MRYTATAILAAAMLASPLPAFSQSTDNSAPVPASVATEPSTATPAPQEQGCVLHVWPGKSFHTVQYGWTHGGTIDGSQKGRKGYPDMPDQPLSAEVQRGEMAKVDIPALLGLSGYRTVMHDAPLETKVIRSTPGRMLKDSGPCHAELMIEDVVYQNNVINGKWLNVIYKFRAFEGTSDAPVRGYSTYILGRVTLFPPDPDTDPQPALDDLRRAFGQTLNDFGKQYDAYLKRNGKLKGAKITL